MPETELLKTEFLIPYKGDNFVFKIPSLFDDVALASRVRKICGDIDPTNPTENGLSEDAMYRVRALATFEVLLTKSSAEWPWSPGKDGKPVVDCQKFPANRAGDALRIYFDYQSQLNTFRDGGNLDSGPPSTEAVAGEPNRGGEPLQP